MDNAQHNREIEANRTHFERKPILRQIYSRFYGMLMSRASKSVHGPAVEIGAGVGFIKTLFPECVTTDQFPNPGIDKLENAYRLSFPDASVASLLLLDVFHHLEFPGSALDEFHRVLKPAGRLLMLEPAMGCLPHQIYHHFHHEPADDQRPIQWQLPEGSDFADLPYFAAQNRATRIFWHQEGIETLACRWKVLEITPFSDFAYLASGGFSGPQLYPTSLHPLISRIDRACSRFPRVFAARMIVVLVKP